jgi:hypothetical protein
MAGERECSLCASMEHGHNTRLAAVNLENGPVRHTGSLSKPTFIDVEGARGSFKAEFGQNTISGGVHGEV